MVLVGIMLAQRRRQWPSITSAIGQCIVLSGKCIWRRVGKRHPHNNAAVSKHSTISQCCFNVGPASKKWVNIGTALGECHVFADMLRVHSGPRVGLVLGQRRRRLTGIEPAMSCCEAGPTLNRNLVGRPISCVQGILQQVAVARYIVASSKQQCGKYYINVGQHRRWWWKEYTLKIYFNLCPWFFI